MYSFEPTEEQQMLVDAVGKYALNDLRAAAREAEESGQLPGRIVNKGWEIGLLQASIPEAYGGFGERSAVTGVLAVEEMAFGDLSGALAVLSPSLFAMPVLLAGSEEQNPSMTTEELRDLIRQAKREPVERDTLYNVVA